MKAPHMAVETANSRDYGSGDSPKQWRKGGEDKPDTETLNNPALPIVP